MNPFRMEETGGFCQAVTHCEDGHPRTPCPNRSRYWATWFGPWVTPITKEHYENKARNAILCGTHVKFVRGPLYVGVEVLEMHPESVPV